MAPLTGEKFMGRAQVPQTTINWWKNNTRQEQIYPEKCCVEKKVNNFDIVSTQESQKRTALERIWPVKLTNHSTQSVQDLIQHNNNKPLNIHILETDSTIEVLHGGRKIHSTCYYGLILEKAIELNLLPFKTFERAELNRLLRSITLHVTFHSSDSLNWNKARVFNCFSIPKTLELFVVF